MNVMKDATSNIMSALPDMYTQAPEGELRTLGCVQTYQCMSACVVANMLHFC